MSLVDICSLSIGNTNVSNVAIANPIIRITKLTADANNTLL